MPVVALIVAVAALAVATAALLVGWRAVRVLDVIATRLDPDSTRTRPALDPDSSAGRVRVESGPNGEEAERPASGELRLLVEPGADRRPVLVLRNDGAAPVDDTVVVIDGWFTGAVGGRYEHDPPPSRLKPGASWRCPIVDPPAPGQPLHVLLRWSCDGALERREVELPC